MKIQVNPNTDASGFDYVEAGKYTFRVKGVEQKQKQGSPFPYLNWTMEFADANILGVAGKKVGGIFDITTLKPEAQFRLRQLSDSLGFDWGDFDTDDCIGREFEAHVTVDLYDPDVPKNKISKYVPVKK